MPPTRFEPLEFILTGAAVYAVCYVLHAQIQ